MFHHIFSPKITRFCYFHILFHVFLVNFLVKTSFFRKLNLLNLFLIILIYFNYLSINYGLIAQSPEAPKDTLQEQSFPLNKKRSFLLTHRKDLFLFPFYPICGRVLTL